MFVDYLGGGGEGLLVALYYQLLRSWYAYQRISLASARGIFLAFGHLFFSEREAG